MPPILLAALSVIVLYVIWDACRTKWEIVIEHEPELGTRMLGVPEAKAQRVRDFFSENVQLSERVKILASRIPPDRFATKFVGNVDPGTRQRIRNYLIDLL